MSENRALIVTYHAIREGPAPLCQTPGALAAQLDALLGAGFHPVPLSQVVDALTGDTPLPSRAFAVTFDDAYADFGSAALPVLEARRVPATLFATASGDRERLAGGLDGPLLPLEALGELAPRGVEVGGHSVGHVDLTTLDDLELERELHACREILERHTGHPVEHFAYPFGRYDARVLAAVGRVFRAACTTALSRVQPGANPLAIPRVDAYYLSSPLLRELLRRDQPEPYLSLRRRLRQWRGSEPVVRLRTAVPSAVEVAACP